MTSLPKPNPHQKTLSALEDMDLEKGETAQYANAILQKAIEEVMGKMLRDERETLTQLTRYAKYMEDSRISNERWHWLSPRYFPGFTILIALYLILLHFQDYLVQHNFEAVAWVAFFMGYIPLMREYWARAPLPECMSAFRPFMRISTSIYFSFCALRIVYHSVRESCGCSVQG